MLSEEQISVLQDGGVGVLPTGSVYGLMASAYSHGGVERVYLLKNRDATKPSIILVSQPSDLEAFGVAQDQIDLSEPYWPGMTSIIFSVPESVPEFLHRGTHSLAFRVPPDEQLREVLAETGPLIAPSANPEGEDPATTIDEAKAYFGEELDFYVDGGMCDDKPSKLIKINDDGVETLRE